MRRIREAAGLTQEAFARTVGRSYASIRSYDAGRKPPLDVAARAMAVAVQVGRNDLADEIQSRAVPPIQTAPGVINSVHVHRLLDQILNSGDEAAMLFTARFLDMSVYWLSRGRSHILSTRAGED